MVRKGKKRRRSGERQLWGEGGVYHLRHFPRVIICFIAPFHFLDGTLEQKDLSARLTFKEYSKLYRESVPKERRWRHFTKVRESMTKTEKKEKENGKLSYYKPDHVAIDSLAPECPIPFLNPLTKLRNGSSSQSSAPDGVSTVLARVRGLASDSSSSDSRCRFLPPPARAAASTAVASVEATDNGEGFSDLSERLGLASETLVSVPSCKGELSYAELKTQSLWQVRQNIQTLDKRLCALAT